MRALIGCCAVLPLLVGCTDVQMLAGAAAEKRRVMNDMQARATVAAVCDISLGAYLREFNEIERTYAGLVCGDDVNLRQAMLPLPARLIASDP